MLVKEAMTQHAEWIDPSISIKEAARIMRERNVGCLPVGENDRLIGMITDRDIVCRGVAEGADCTTAKSRDVMSKGITWCFEDQDLQDAARLMEEKQIHHLPVLSREKRMVGILSMSDLALKGPQDLYSRLSKLASRDSSRHAAGAERPH
jgi:CBS domain-containing protein